MADEPPLEPLPPRGVFPDPPVAIGDTEPASRRRTIVFALFALAAGAVGIVWWWSVDNAPLAPATRAPGSTTAPQPLLPELRGVRLVAAAPSRLLHIDLATGAIAEQPANEVAILANQIVDRQGYTALLSAGQAVLVPDDGGARFVSRAETLVAGADAGTIWLDGDGHARAVRDPFGSTTTSSVHHEGRLVADLGGDRLLIERGPEFVVLDVAGNDLGVAYGSRDGLPPIFIAATSDTVVWAICEAECDVFAATPVGGPGRLVAHLPFIEPGSAVSTDGHRVCMITGTTLTIVSLDGAAPVIGEGLWTPDRLPTMTWIAHDRWILLARDRDLIAVRFTAGADPVVRRARLPNEGFRAIAVDEH
jgi:hypothetical protein